MLESAGLLAQVLGTAFVTSSLGAAELMLALLVGAGFIVSNARGRARGSAEHGELQRVPVRRRNA